MLGSLFISIAILLKLNIVDLICLLYFYQMIGVSEVLKLFGIEDLEDTINQ